MSGHMSSSMREPQVHRPAAQPGADGVGEHDVLAVELEAGGLHQRGRRRLGDPATSGSTCSTKPRSTDQRARRPGDGQRLDELLVAQRRSPAATADRRRRDRR